MLCRMFEASWLPLGLPSGSGWPVVTAVTEQSRLPGEPRGRGRNTPSPGRRLDESGLQREPGQVGTPPAACLVPDPVQVRADRADADVELLGDLDIGPALGDQRDQLLLTRAEPRYARRSGRLAGILGGRPGRVLRRDRQRHGRSTGLRRVSPLCPQSLAGLAQRLLPAPRVAGLAGDPPPAPPPPAPHP